MLRLPDLSVSPINSIPVALQREKENHKRATWEDEPSTKWSQVVNEESANELAS